MLVVTIATVGSFIMEYFSEHRQLTENIPELVEKINDADSGKIVIVITHTPDRVADLFDDVIVVAKDANRTGRLAYYGARKKSYGFFGKKSMEEILMSVNRREEGGEGKADEFVRKYTAAVAGGEL